MGKRKKKKNLSRNAGQKEEASWRSTSVTPALINIGAQIIGAPEDGSDMPAPGTIANEVSADSVFGADGQAGRWVSERMLLGLYPHFPCAWVHRWQYQLANEKDEVYIFYVLS